MSAGYGFPEGFLPPLRCLPLHNGRQTLCECGREARAEEEGAPDKRRENDPPPGAVARTARPEQQRQDPHRVPAAAAASPSDALQVQTSQSEAGSMSTHTHTRLYDYAPPRRKVAPHRRLSVGILTAPRRMKTTYVVRLSTCLYPLHRRPNNCG